MQSCGAEVAFAITKRRIPHLCTRDDNPGESRPRDPGESHILGPGFSPGFIDGIPGLQE